MGPKVPPGDRPRVRFWRGRSLIVAVAGLAAVTMVACGDASVSVEEQPSTTTIRAEVELASPRPVADDPDPVVRAGAAGRFIACAGPVHLGGWSADFGGPGPAADPHGALEAFLSQGLFGLPTTGFREAAHDQGRVLFTYDVDTEAKVAVIVADVASAEVKPGASEGWVVETFATCDPAEYDPSADDELLHAVWTDRDGNRVPTSTITSLPGPEHCDWQSVTFLHLDGRQYVSDPEQRLTNETVAAFDGDVELPEDAIDTGFQRGNDQLWLAADESIAYVVTADAVEAWPATTEHVACR